MRPTKPSVTARVVALTRAELSRPEVATGDAASEARLYASLGRVPLWRPNAQWKGRMDRRTRFFDRVTIAAIERGVAQVVIIAAGYDGRPLRFATPGVRWFEVDHPSTQADKRTRLSALDIDTGAISFVPLDLNSGELIAALAEAGYDRDEPALFVVEGLLGYLPMDTTERLLTDLRKIAAPSSKLAVAFPLNAPQGSLRNRFRHRVRAWMVSAVGEPWVTRFSGDDVDRLFAVAGWRVTVESDAPLRFQGERGVLILGEPAPAS